MEESQELVVREPTTDELIVATKQELEGLNEEARRLVGEEAELSDSTALVTTSVDPEVVDAQLRRRRSETMRVQKAIREQTATLSKLMRKQVEEVERRANAELRKMEQMLAPLQKQLKVLEEAVWTVNLYLGKDEKIIKLADGAPASEMEPIQVRQLVLAMDQEAAVAAEEGGIDSMDIGEFDAWLTADPAHVEQVIPERKAVVALVPRWKDHKDYGHDTVSNMVAEANHQTYFLIRNGEQLYRTVTDFRIGQHLVPTASEFTRYFVSRTYDFKTMDYVEKPLEPGSDAWYKAQEKAEARQRDFMRVALILEGLIHRTTVFQPLHPSGVGFLDTRHHEDGRVRFIMDAEKTLGTGREPFFDWITRLNGQLRPGMRIVGNFRSEEWRAANKDADDDYADRRIRPKGAHSPRSGVIYRIEDREGEALIIRYKREGTYFDRNAWVPNPDRPGWGHRGDIVEYKKRASALLFPEDSFIVPIDLVTEEEVRGYLSSRLERSEYISMFPVLKAALRALAAERQLEEPLVTMLAGVLARENGVTVEEAREELPDLVRWFKLANKIHRPLLFGAHDTNEMALPKGMDPDDVDLVLIDPATGNADGSLAVTQIVKEHRRRMKDREGGGNDAEARQLLLGRHPHALVIARLRKGGYLVVEAMDPVRNVWSREVEYSLSGARTGEPRATREWTLVGARPARWIILHEDKRWSEWDFAASRADHLTGPEEEQLVEQARREPGALGVTYREKKGKRRYEVWISDSTTRTDVSPSCRPIDWKRDGERLVATPRYYGHSYTWFDSATKAPWDPSEHGRYNRYWTPMWEDRDGLDRVREQMKRNAELAKVERAQESIAIAAHRSIVDQWEKQAHDEAFAKFMADYGDEELWEGHLKANPVPNYPYWGSSMETPPAQRALNVLVKKGVDPWGLTVREAWEKAVELGMELEDKTWRSKHPEPPEAIADMRFVRPARKDAPQLEAGDDDDLDWDD